MPELNHITELANEYRQQVVADLAPEFPGREVYALAAALAIMFATSMTPDQARILNDHVTLEACPAMATGQAFELSATVRGGGRHIYPPVLHRGSRGEQGDRAGLIQEAGKGSSLRRVGAA
jgi:hypothetical protein